MKILGKAELLISKEHCAFKRLLPHGLKIKNANFLIDLKGLKIIELCVIIVEVQERGRKIGACCCHTKHGAF